MAAEQTNAQDTVVNGLWYLGDKAATKTKDLVVAAWKKIRDNETLGFLPALIDRHHDSVVKQFAQF